MRFEHKAPFRLKETDNISGQWMLVAFGAPESIEAGEAVPRPRVERLQMNRPAFAWGDFARGLNIDRDVYCHRPGMKEIERPKINRGPGEIRAARGLSINLV